MSEDGLTAQIQDLFNKSGVEEARQAPKDVFEPYKQELQKYIDEMKTICRMHPDQAMAWLSSVSARVLEMIYRTLDSETRTATKFRIDRLLPLRDELRYQYQIASRRVTHEKFEWDMANGQST